MIEAPRPAAAILAGGLARRLGGARKAVLRVGGVRIIDRQLAALCQVTDAVFIVAPDPAPYADLALPVVADVIPGCGALGGIYTAIAMSPRERTLIVACDMPFLNVPLLKHLTGFADADIVIPRSARGYEPLCAVYSKTCAEPIRRRLERGELEATIMAEGLRVEEIGPEIVAAYDPDGLLFVNVNTPHDYEHAQGRCASMPEAFSDRIMDDP